MLTIYGGKVYLKKENKQKKVFFSKTPKKKASLHDLHLWSSNLSNKMINSQKNVGQPENVFENKVAPSIITKEETKNQDTLTNQNLGSNKMIKVSSNKDIEESLNNHNLVKNELKESKNLTQIVNEFKESMISKDATKSLDVKKSLKYSENSFSNAENNLSKNIEENDLLKKSLSATGKESDLSKLENTKKTFNEFKGNKLVTYFYYIWTQNLVEELKNCDSMRRNRKSSRRGGNIPTPEKAKKKSEQTQTSINTSRNCSTQKVSDLKGSIMRSQNLDKMIIRSDIMQDYEINNLDTNLLDNRIFKTAGNYYKTDNELIPEVNNELQETTSNLENIADNFRFDSQIEINEELLKNSNLLDQFTKPVGDVDLEKPLTIDDLTKPIKIEKNDEISVKNLSPKKLKKLEILGQKDTSNTKGNPNTERFKRKNFRLYNHLVDSTLDSKNLNEDFSRNKNINQSGVKIKNKLNMNRKRSIDLVRGGDENEAENSTEKQAILDKSLENSDVEVAIKFEDPRKSFTTIHELDAENSTYNM